MIPIVMYDDQCYLCIKFAKIVNWLGQGKLTIIGHYSELGRKLRKEILDSSALEMFWFVDGKTAFGGRAALIPLLKAIIFEKKKRIDDISINENCETECKNVKAVFLRSASLLSNSKIIKIK